MLKVVVAGRRRPLRKQTRGHAQTMQRAKSGVGARRSPRFPEFAALISTHEPQMSGYSSQPRFRIADPPAFLGNSASLCYAPRIRLRKRGNLYAPFKNFPFRNDSARGLGAPRCSPPTKTKKEAAPKGMRRGNTLARKCRSPKRNLSISRCLSEHPRISSHAFAHHGVCLRSDGWHRSATDGLAKREARERMDPVSVKGHGLRERASRRLGRIRNGAGSS